MKSERRESFQQKLFLGAVVLVALPCMSTGPIGMSLCILGEFGVGIVGLNWAKGAMNVSLGQSFMGLEEMNMLTVEQKGHELKLERFFLPLGVWLSFADVFHNLHRLSRVPRDVLVNQGEEVLSRSFTRDQGEALWDAHITGRAELGGDNKPTGHVDNILMQKTFTNVSAVLDDEVFVKLGWQQFQGSAKEFQELLGKILNADGSLKEEYFGQPGYFKFAKDHYGGAMQKTFINVSSILDDEVFTKLGWQQFQGSAREFQELIGKIFNPDNSLKEEYFSQQGYFKFAEDHYADNMKKTFQNVSSVLDDEVFVKLGWQHFQGNASEFQELIGKILNTDDSLKIEYFGQPGYLRFAEDHYGGAMQKAFINVSSVLDDEVFVKLGWQAFHGNAREFQELIGKILNVDGSLKEEYFGKPGYLRFAEDHYGGAMQKAFQNVSAVLDDEVFVKLGWQKFHGSASEFQELIGKILNTDDSLKIEYFGQPGYLRFAEDHYGGAMQKAFINVSSVLDDEVFVKLGWQQFRGSTREFQDLIGKILNADGSLKEEYFGKPGLSPICGRSLWRSHAKSFYKCIFYFR